MYQYEDDDDRQQDHNNTGRAQQYRDFYRKNFTKFSSVVNHFHYNRLYIRSFKERRWMQPHYSSLIDITLPYSNILNPADGICGHFLKRGFVGFVHQKALLTCAIWSPDARWLLLATDKGDLAVWESEGLKVTKAPISVPAHKEIVEGDRIVNQFSITAMAWKHFGNLVVTGDENGLIQYCDETFRNVFVTSGAHTRAVRGLSFSPLDTKLASCSDDAKIKIWSGVRDKAEVEMLGHSQDIKCIDWHPYRSLIATGSRDTTVKLWDPKSKECVSTIACSERQVNCCQWNMNGNWLAAGATDGFVKIYDIRTMKELEAWRVNNGEDSVCKVAWHPVHESLLVSGSFNGSLAYWIVGQENNQVPHTLIRDAHRLSIDALAWHPAGNLLASTSHDHMLKFWSREPPGSTLEHVSGEFNPEMPPNYYHGPIPADTPIAAVRNPSTTPAPTATNNNTNSGRSFHRQGGMVTGQQQRTTIGGTRDYYRERRPDNARDGNLNKRPRNFNTER